MPKTQQIDTQRVKNAGEDLKNIAEEMFKVLDAAKGHVKNTESFFKSDGGNEIRRNFYDSAEKFSKFRDFMREYGEYLIAYAKNVEEINTKIADIGKKIPKL